MHAARGEFLQSPFAVGIVAYGGSELDVQCVGAAQGRGGGGTFAAGPPTALRIQEAVIRSSRWGSTSTRAM